MECILRNSAVDFTALQTLRNKAIKLEILFDNHRNTLVL